MKTADLSSLFDYVSIRDLERINQLREGYCVLAKVANNVRASLSTVNRRKDVTRQWLMTMCPDNDERRIALDWLETFVNDRADVIHPKQRTPDFDALRTSMLWASESIVRGRTK